MKRVLSSSHLFSEELPDEVWSLIVLPLYGHSPGLTQVCKKWQSLVEGHQQWFERAWELYWPLHVTLYFERKENWLKRSSSLSSHQLPVYQNYGGPGRNNDETIMTHHFLDSGKLTSPLPVGRNAIYREVHMALHYLKEYMPQDEASGLKNYIGRLFVAKYQKLTEDYDLTPIPNLYPLLVYIRQETSSILVRRNFHPRDLFIRFQEEGHQYTLRFWCQERNRYVTIRSTKSEDDNGPLNLGLSADREKDFFYQLLSGTGFIGSLFPPFDADEAARNSHDKTKTVEEKKEEWRLLGEKASRKGTKMHLNFENDVLGRPCKRKGRSYNHYQAYRTKIVVGKMREYRTEWMIWDSELMICGSVDILYEEWPPRNCPGRDPTKKYLILGDYKRSKEIKRFNPYQSGIPECKAVANAGDCNYIHYMIQLNLYKYILEKNYNVVILRTFIIVLHPDQDTFIKIDLNPPPGFMESIIEYRRQTLLEKRTKHDSTIESNSDTLSGK